MASVFLSESSFLLSLCGNVGVGSQVGLFVIDKCIHLVVVVSFVHDNSYASLSAGSITVSLSFLSSFSAC